MGRQECLSPGSGIVRADKGKKLVARLLVMAEATQHGTGHGLAVLLFDAAHLHTEVTRLDDHANTLRADFFLNGRSDLAGEALLDLQAPREHIDEPRDFAETDDALVGKIGDMALAEKRQQMVLAEAEEFDVLHDHDLIVGNAEGRAVENIFRILVITAGQEFQRLFVAFRRFTKAFAIRVFPDQLDDLANVAGDPARVKFLLIVQHDFFRRFSHHIYLSKPSGLSPAYSKLLLDVS